MEQKSDQAATIAIISCSLAIVMAIVIGLLFFLNPGDKDDLVEVPNLVGKEFEEIPKKV